MYKLLCQLFDYPGKDIKMELARTVINREEEPEEEQPETGQVDPTYRLQQTIYGSGKSLFSLEHLSLHGQWEKLWNRYTTYSADTLVWAVNEPSMSYSSSYYTLKVFVSAKEAADFIRTHKQEQAELKHQQYLNSVVKILTLPVVL